MADRITDKILNELAEELNETTGEKFFVNHPNGLPTLYCKKNRGVVTCFSGDSKRDLYDQIIRFQAGIAFGLQVASDGKHPDLKDPEKALTRISKDLGVLLRNADLGTSPAGYIDRLESVSAKIGQAIDYAASLEDEG